MLELVKLIKILNLFKQQSLQRAFMLEQHSLFLVCLFVKKKRKEKEIQFFSFNLPPHQTLHLFQSNNSFSCVNK